MPFTEWILSATPQPVDKRTVGDFKVQYTPGNADDRGAGITFEIQIGGRCAVMTGPQAAALLRTLQETIGRGHPKPVAPIMRRNVI